MTNDAASQNYSSLRDVRAAPDTLIREGTFFIGGGGGGGIGIFFTNWGGANLFLSHRGRVTVFFDKEKITPCRLVDSY